MYKSLCLRYSSLDWVLFSFLLRNERKRRFEELSQYMNVEIKGGRVEENLYPGGITM